MKYLIENWRRYIISEAKDTSWSAKCMIFDDAGRILLVEVANRGTLDLPGGHGQDDETPMEAVKREVLEEIGLNISKILKIGTIEQGKTRYIFAALDYSGTFELQLEEVSDYQWYPVDELIIDVDKESNLFEDTVILAVTQFTKEIRDVGTHADRIEYYDMYPRYKVGEYEAQKTDRTDPNEI